MTLFIVNQYYVLIMMFYIYFKKAEL